MTITFTVPTAKISRISASLDFYGYVFDSTLGTTDATQRINFFIGMTITDWQSLLFNYERNAAIIAGTSEAQQARTFIGLSDVTGVGT